MKISFLVFLIFLSVLPVNAQINFISTPEPESRKTDEVYDSLTNINPLNWKLLVGQQIQPLPKDYLKKKGYFFGLNLYSKRPKKVYHDYTYLVSPVKDDLGGYRTSFDELAGQVYNIVGTDSILSFGKPYYFLKVLKNEQQDTMLLSLGEVSASYQDKNPEFMLAQGELMVVGYFEKLKKSMIGKKYVLHNSRNIRLGTTDHPVIIDAETGAPLERLTFEMPITITDVGYYKGGETPGICFILSSDKFRNALMLKSDLRFTLYDYDLYLKDRQRADEWVASIKKKYPAGIANKILDRTIDVGFTEEMVRDAWGEPVTIHCYKSTYGIRVHWIYDDSYVYFKNGRVISIHY